VVVDPLQRRVREYQVPRTLHVFYRQEFKREPGVRMLSRTGEHLGRIVDAENGAARERLGESACELARAAAQVYHAQPLANLD
jgi:hypothetical protein